MRIASLVALCAMLFLVPCAPGALAADSKADKAKQKVAQELVAWAGWCARNGAPDQGRLALATAQAFGAETEAPLVADLDAASQTADEDTVARGLKVHGSKVAKAYDELASVRHEDGEEPEFAGYRIEALRWDPSKSRAKKVVRWIDGLEDAGLAARLYARAWEAAGEDAADAVTGSVAERAKDELLLLGSAHHPLVAFVSLPKGWKPGRSYPVLIGVDGAGSGFQGYGRSSTTARGSRDVIGLYPMTFSNTNALDPKKYPHYDPALLDANASLAERMRFDLEGVNAVLALVQAHLGGEERVFLTGFSGGGQFTYLKLLQQPDTVAGAVPCCGNFGGGGVQGAPGAGESGGPPVLILTGDKDPHREFTHGDPNSPGIEPQSDAAQAALEKLGYTHVRREMVPAGHSPLHEKVWAFVDEVLEAR